MNYAKGLFSDIDNFLTESEADRYQHLNMIVNGVIEGEDRESARLELNQMMSGAYVRCLEITINHLVDDCDLTDSDDLQEIREAVQDKLSSQKSEKNKRTTFELKLFAK